MSFMKTYKVEVSFAGMIGAEEVYTVDAENDEEAISEALEQARDDLSIDDLTEVDEDEWEGDVGFCGYVGVSESYSVYATSEDEAYDEILEAAFDDLAGEIISVDDERAEAIASICGRPEINPAQMNALQEDWKAFYMDPEKFEGSPIVDMINQYLDEVR